jgi:hypothetical protein
VERPIEGPNTTDPYLTSDQAGQWIGGFKEDLFESLMAEHMPTVQPVYMGRFKYWHWMDVAILAYVLRRSVPSLPPQKKAGRNPPEPAGGGTT